MTGALHLATAEDFAKLEALVAVFHAEHQITSDATHRQTALQPLLEGSPYGVAYLIGPRRAPVGYVIVTFTWSMAFVGLSGTIEEVFIRPNVRGRGMASNALFGLCQTLENNGVVALHVEGAPNPSTSSKLFARLGFRAAEHGTRLTRLR